MCDVRSLNGSQMGGHPFEVFSLILTAILKPHLYFTLPCFDLDNSLVDVEDTRELPDVVANKGTPIKFIDTGETTQIFLAYHRGGNHGTLSLGIPAYPSIPKSRGLP